MKYALIIMVAAVLGSCKPAKSPYDKLCAIYQDYASKPDSDTVAMIELAERVSKEAPEVEPVFSAAVRNPPATRYPMFLQEARKDQPTWECPAIKARWP